MITKVSSFVVSAGDMYEKKHSAASEKIFFIPSADGTEKLPALNRQATDNNSQALDEIHTIHQRNRIHILSQKTTSRKSSDRTIITGSASHNNKKAKTLSSIMKSYDIENISPKKMAEMSQELFDNGHISFKVHSFLSFQPELNPSFHSTVSKLANTTGNPDQPRNFFKEWQDQLKELQKEGASGIIISNTKEVLTILGKLHALQKG